MKLKLGLQTITWGDPQNQQIQKILSTAEKAGFDGVEIGWRRITTFPHQQFRELLRQHSLCLAASHLGGNLDDESQAGSERNGIESIIDGVTRFGGEFLLYSGSHSDLSDPDTKIDSLNRAAITCQRKGLQLLYHNHDFEFSGEQTFFDSLVTRTVPELGFAPDVGWIHKAGLDVLPTLECIRNRIRMVHFKDFKSTENTSPLDTCPLGQGVVPLKDISEWLATLNHDELWVIAEQDRYDEGSPEEAARLNGAFLKDCFGGNS